MTVSQQVPSSSLGLPHSLPSAPLWAVIVLHESRRAVLGLVMTSPPAVCFRRALSQLHLSLSGLHYGRVLHPLGNRTYVRPLLFIKL